MDRKCGYVVWSEEKLKVERFLFHHIELLSEIKYFIGLSNAETFHGRSIYLIDNAPDIRQYKIILIGEWEKISLH